MYQLFRLQHENRSNKEVFIELITAPNIDKDTDIYLISDTHIGSALCYEKGLNKVVKKISSDKVHNKVVFQGDANEAILITDKRFTLGATKHIIIEDQVKVVADIFSPIADNIICWMVGNHEAKLWNYGNIGKQILNHMKIERPVYGGYSCVINYKDKKKNTIFKQYATHGKKALNNSNPDPLKRRAFLLSRLKDYLFRKASDCLVMSRGHSHKLLVREPMRELHMTYSDNDLKQNYTTPNMISNGFILEDQRWYVCTGSFLKTTDIGVTGYAEAFELDPVELGYAVIEVRGGKVVRVREEFI